MSNLFGDGAGVLEGYVGVRVHRAGAPPGLIEDLEGVEYARWLVEVIRQDFEQICGGARVYGPPGTWDGVIAGDMPGYWRGSDSPVSMGMRLWKPDGRHPLGKWIEDMAGRLMAFPPPEVLDAVLRRHGIEGSREPVPSMRVLDDGDFALLVHKPNAKAFSVPGIAREPRLAGLWVPGPADRRA